MAVGIEFVLNMVEMARLLVVFLKSSKSLGKERGDPLLTVLWRKPPKMAFKNSISFVSDRSFTAASGLLKPTGCVKTTPQRSHSRDVQQATNMATVRVDDDKIK